MLEYTKLGVSIPMEGEGQGQSQSQIQSVVLAHDASRGLKVNSLRLILDKFLWKDGDVFTFLSVVHQIQHPMGYMMRVDSSMLNGVNQKAIDDEIANKKKEYEDNNELVQISELCETQKVDFKIELLAGPILKNVVVEASKAIKATWLILDKRMKGDKKYFLEKLSCGISIMDRNDNIIKIRGPIQSRNPTTRLTYNGTLTVNNGNRVREPQNDEDLFSIELGSSCTSCTSTPMLLEINGETEVEHVETLPPMLEEKVQLDKKKCTTCNSTRPTSNAWQQSRNFSYSEIVEATNRFSSENLLYRGENEVVFHGILKGSKLNVVVKVQHDTKKYQSEVQALEQTRNEHVIMLLGICLEETARLLVFEYACNGSLDQHLSDQQYPRALTWLERIKIATGTCRGLNHLHGNNIIHGDIRPKNIWLTHDCEPLIAGFGLASMIDESQNSMNHCIIGTLGYIAPECKETGKATTKTDVYAFGITLLQLVTGLSPTDTRLQGQTLTKWSNSLVKEKKFSELVDPRIEYDINQVVNMVQLALKCVHKDPHLRLSTDKVMLVLDYIKDEKTNYEGQRADETQEVNGNMETNVEGQHNDESQEVNGNMETNGQGQHDDETQEVNVNMETNGQSQEDDENKEIIMETNGQNQRHIDEKLIYSYDDMTSLPKQAKHFYQGEII